MNDEEYWPGRIEWCKEYREHLDKRKDVPYHRAQKTMEVFRDEE